MTWRDSPLLSLVHFLTWFHCWFSELSNIFSINSFSALIFQYNSYTLPLLIQFFYGQEHWLLEVDMIIPSSAGKRGWVIQKLYYLAYGHTVNIRTEMWTHICLMPSLCSKTQLLLVKKRNYYKAWLTTVFRELHVCLRTQRTHVVGFHQQLRLLLGKHQVMMMN